MRTLSLFGILLGVLSGLFYFLDSHLDRFYIFDPEDLHDVSKAAIAAHGNNTASIVQYIVSDLRAKLPAHISQNEEWFFNNAGGAMGGVYILHASITEYLIIFGSAVGTEGHTGRHTADDYFHILSGTQLTYELGDYEPQVYPPGSVNLMKRGVARQYKMDTACFALEYARGWIPPMLFFGYADGT
jgi:C-8 sterol isomerase